MKHNYLISVIVPNYCHSQFLKLRIESILNQTYQNFELIILDDCSPDEGKSKSIIESYRDNVHITHIVYNDKNSGSTFIQWQKGFELAKGDIIWIAESDDYCLPTFLEEVIKCWNSHPDCSIIQCASRYVDENGIDIEKKTYSHKILYDKGLVWIKRHMICSCFLIPNASAVTFKKEIAKEIPQDYMTYQSAGDRLFWIYLLERGNMCHIDKPLNYYRQHTEKVSTGKQFDGTQCRENFIINKYLKKKGYINYIIANEEYRFYWNYIHFCDFSSETIRKELLKLWFPWWKRNRLYEKYNDISYRLYGLLYRIKLRLFK